MREDVIRAGLTVGCPGCTVISKGAQPQNQAEGCRKKVEDFLIKQGGEKAKLSQEGRNRVKRVRLGDPESDEQAANVIEITEPADEKRARDEDYTEEEDRADKYQATEEDEQDDMLDLIRELDSEEFWDNLSGKEL